MIFSLIVTSTGQLPDGVDTPGCIGMQSGDQFKYKSQTTINFRNGSSYIQEANNLSLRIISIPEVSGYLIDVTITEETISNTQTYNTSRNLNYIPHEFRWINQWDQYRNKAANNTLEEISSDKISEIYSVGETENTFTLSVVAFELGSNLQNTGNIEGYRTQLYNKTNGVLLSEIKENYLLSSDIHYSSVTTKVLVEIKQQDLEPKCQAIVDYSTDETTEISFFITFIFIIPIIYIFHKLEK